MTEYSFVIYEFAEHIYIVLDMESVRFDWEFDMLEKICELRVSCMNNFSIVFVHHLHRIEYKNAKY